MQHSNIVEYIDISPDANVTTEYDQAVLAAPQRKIAHRRGQRAATGLCSWTVAKGPNNLEVLQGGKRGTGL